MKSIEELSKAMAHAGSLVRNRDEILPSARLLFASKRQSKIYEEISEQLKNRAAWLYSQKIKHGFITDGITLFFTDAIKYATSDLITIDVRAGARYLKGKGVRLNDAGYADEEYINELLSGSGSQHPSSISYEVDANCASASITLHYSHHHTSYSQQFEIERTSPFHKYVTEAIKHEGLQRRTGLGTSDWTPLLFRSPVDWNNKKEDLTHPVLDDLQDVLSVAEEYPAIADLGINKMREEYAEVVKMGVFSPWELTAKSLSAASNYLRHGELDHSLKGWSQSDKCRSFKEWCGANSIECEYHEPRLNFNVRFTENRLFLGPKNKNRVMAVSQSWGKIGFVRLTLK